MTFFKKNQDNRKVVQQNGSTTGLYRHGKIPSHATLGLAATETSAGQPFTGSALPGNNSSSHGSPDSWTHSRRSDLSSILHKINFKILGVVSLFTLICIGLVSFVLVWQFEDNVAARQQPGEVALADIMSPKSHTYSSQVKAKELGDAAAASSANRVFKRDMVIVNREREALLALLNLLALARSSGQPDSEAIALISQPAIGATGLTTRQLGLILNWPDSTWTQVSQEAKTAYSILMNRDINPGETTLALNILRDAVLVPYTLSGTFAQLDEATREITTGLVRPYIKVNTVLDQEASRKKQDDSRSAVGTTTVDIIKGTAVVRRGDVLTPLQIEQLSELGLRNNRNNSGQVWGTIGVAAMVVLLLVFYCSMLANHIWASPRWLMFLTVCISVAALAMRVLIVDAGKDSSRPYLLPLAAVAMVLAALFDVQLALFLGSLLALLAGLVGGTPELVAYFLAGSAAGALTIRRAEHTSVFAYAGVAVAVAQFLAGISSIMLNRTLEASNVTPLFFFSVLNGLISASLAFFCFSVLGKLFGVATVLQLLELAHPNQPLLRRLIREAPGTYHHSILVSNLAEQAAERVADNALLARVGAYYHDIGKLSRPTFFIDNQAGGANIHDTLDPRESARFIKAHVSDGVVLARKHNLPRKVVDIIHQHHGTCTVSFFYQKALKMGLDVNELEFRYPGPKPQTKVAAIVMLADGCEAAVRANVQSGRILTGTVASVPGAPNPETDGSKLMTIRQVVDKIIDDRIKENQLSECDLTLRDVEEIRGLFVEILTSIYHPRIIYPDKDVPSISSAHEPIRQDPPVTVVSTTTREVPVALTALPVLVTSAADGGGDIEQPVSQAGRPELPGLSSLTKMSGRVTENLANQKSGIGGAGKAINN